jgi:DNA (cytosine-5)-methyltransferase 1
LSLYGLPPPCPTHSRARFWGHGEDNPIYPDMTLYEEILFLRHYFEGKWVVENVKPFYKQLLPSYELGRHLYWSNFHIADYKVREFDIHNGKNQEGTEIHGFDLSKYSGVDRKTILRNCVEPELGLHIFNESKREVYSDLFK